MERVIILSYDDPQLDLTVYRLGHVMREILIEYDKLEQAEDRTAVIAMIKSLSTAPPVT